MIEWLDVNDAVPPDCPDYILGAIGKMYLVYFIDLKHGKKNYNVGISEWVYGEKQFRNNPSKSIITHWAPVNLPGKENIYVWDELQYDRCREQQVNPETSVRPGEVS